MITKRSRQTGRRQFMATMGRRSMLSGSLGITAATALPRPRIGKVAATTATVWWQQSFIPEEDAGFRRLVADYEKASGNTIYYSIIPFTTLGQHSVERSTP